MDDKTTNESTTQRAFLKSKQWHTIESAASLMVLNDVVKGENWYNNAEIQEAYKALRDEALKAFRYSKLKISVYEAIELIENNPHLAVARKDYPDLTRKDLIMAVERFFERELAVSLTALYDVIKSENWHDTVEIQIQKSNAKEMLSITCKSLLENVCKVCKDSESIIKKGKIIELVEKDSNVWMFIERYPDINHQQFVTLIERFFKKALSDFTRTFDEISKGLSSEYRVSKALSGIKDFERDIEYTPEYIKTAMEASLVIETLISDTDKFGLDSCFYPEEEIELDYSRFYPVSIKPDAPKGYLEVRTEGIIRWLKRGFDKEIHDKFFNPKPEKTEMEITETPKPAASSPDADNSKDQPKKKNRREKWPDPFAGLNLSIDLNVYAEHFDCLTKQQHDAFILRFAYELDDTDIGKRLGVSRQRARQIYEDATRKIDNNRKKSR